MVSEAEIAVIRKCRWDSLIQRSLPLATIFSFGTYRMMRHRSLKWIVPMVLLNSSAGYIIGKMSYVPVCIDKLLELPDSEIGNVIRKRRYGMPENADDEEPTFFQNGEVYTDEHLRSPDKS